MAIRVGIIGIGNQGGYYAEHMNELSKYLEVTAVADINPARLEWAKDNVPNAARFNDGIALLDSGLVDACVVVTPHYDHPKYAMEAMKRGIHVLVDKPAGVYTKQVKEMNAMADAHPEVKFGVMFCLRTIEVYKKLHDLMQSGEYGQMRRMSWMITTWYRPQAYYDSGSWRATWAGEGGAVLLNQCPHQLDLLQWICGMPVTVQSHVHFGKWHDIETEDDVTAYFEFENGATGTFITSTGDAKGTNRLEIQMDNGRFLVENDTLTIDKYEMPEPTFTKTNDSPFAALQSTTEEFHGTTPENFHFIVFDAWAETILGTGEAIADGREGLRSTELANAMLLSAFLNRRVTLPFDDELYYQELMKRVGTSKAKTVKATVNTTDMSSTFSGAK